MSSIIDEPLAPSFSAADLNKIKQKKEILNLLRVNGYSSSPELSKLIKISLPTCNALLNDLISLGYVKDFGIGESSGGRRPHLFGLPNDGFYVLSCDFARYYASMTVCNCYNKFVTPVVKIDTHMDDPDLVEKLYQTAQKLITDHHIPDEKIYGLGVDMPGLIDSKAGINFTIKDIKCQNIGDKLKQKFNKLIYIDNDARMHAHGEYHFGAAKEYRDAIILHWSWGLGGKSGQTEHLIPE